MISSSEEQSREPPAGTRRIAGPRANTLRGKLSLMPFGGGNKAGLSLVFAVACSGEPMSPEDAVAGAGGAGGSSAGAGTGGLVITGGAAGTTASGGTGGGIAIGCPECPEGAYGLIVSGDGEGQLILQNAPGTTSTDCPAEPLRGSTAGCGGSGVYFSACESESGTGVCLSVLGSMASYTDRSGTVWTGSVVSLSHQTPVPPVEVGLVTLALSAGDRTLELTVDFAFCGVGSFARVVC
jgi:hypothetical protein